MAHGMHRDRHRTVHLAALALAIIALPWSEFLMSLSQIILVVNWCWQKIAARNTPEGRVGPGPEGWVFLSFYGLHVLGLAWTTDLQWGLDLCRSLLPALVFGLILSTTQRLSAAELKRLLLLGAWSAVVSTFACMALRYPMLATGQYRELSPFISHIRLVLMLCFALAIFLRYWPKAWWARFAFAGAMGWIIWFMALLSSLTAVPVLSALAVFGTWRLVREWGAGWRLATTLLLCAVAGLVIWSARADLRRMPRPDPAQLQHLPYTSAGGEVYWHDRNDPQVENGHFVWVDVAEGELARAWQRRSTLPYDGHDERGQPLRSTLVRYLASKGLRKDSVGMRSMRAEDIARVEQGMTSVMEGRRGLLGDRLDEVRFEIERYRTAGEPNGHSLVMRLEFQRAGFFILKQHPWTGVGTGDTRPAFAAAYDSIGSRLLPQWRLRAHNEFLTLAISFGVLGMLWCLFSWAWPAWRLHAFHEPLFVAWAIIFVISCISEDTIETQAGATFFALYYALFVFASPVSAAKVPAPAQEVSN